RSRKLWRFNGRGNRQGGRDELVPPGASGGWLGGGTRLSRPRSKGLPQLLQCATKIGHETFGELDRVARGKMRPFGTLEARQLRVILKINTGRIRLFEQWIPGSLTRGLLIFQLLQLAADRKAHENNFTAALAQLVD